ncbi:MAG: deoxyribodipyrimidine photo-lyase [Bacteroidota bacterium]
MKISIFWFRRDLRLHDNAGFYRALKGEHPVLPIFIFDKHILDELPVEDARVEFIHDVLHELKEELKEEGGALEVQYDTPEAAWKFLLEKYDIGAVYTNHDYEPYAKNRDAKIKELLAEQDVEFHTFKDHVIFEREEVVKSDGDPYVVFTPYSRVWKSKLNSRISKDKNGEDVSYYLKAYPNKKYFSNLYQSDPKNIPTLEHMGFKSTKIEIPDRTVTQGLIRTYDETRNFPAIDGTSRLGIHFRFGTISIREKARKAQKLNETFLNELIWRDFYSMIMNHFPRVVDRAFRAKYDTIPWRNDKEDFEKWCIGKTGYPIVDAGMRELNNTGYMHNRVRMITASFLTKHLLIDWRWGEAYFAEKLLDYELASNNGGWQWAAGSGTDAAPYFRIFNPTSQQKKFDKDFKYIKEWIPEYGTDRYPEPMVDHKEARQRCLETYKTALDRAEG